MPRQYTVKFKPILFLVSPSLAYVPLTKGQFALIDSSDAAEVQKHSWHAKYSRHGRCFYAATHGKDSRGGRYRQITIYLHNFIAKVVGSEVDHVQPERTLDCRRANLRQATRFQQCFNRRNRTDNTTGFKGVSFHAQSGKYRASITSERKRISLGLHATPELAYAAYCAAAKIHHGDFARTE